MQKDKMLSLYRGDYFENEKSKPFRYYSEGITSSAFGAGGDPNNIERISFLETIKQHIDHLKAFEKEYFKITDYVSFSDTEETAKKWAAGLTSEKLVPFDVPYQETRYVFKLNIPVNDLNRISEGVWEYNFACNKDLKDGYQADDCFKTYALRARDCPVCGGITKAHRLVLVSTLAFLSDRKGDDRFDRANILALKNSEWLILPYDLIDHKHRATRIPRADFWTVNHYILENEDPRDPNFDYP